jgi:hypothetical protein
MISNDILRNVKMLQRKKKKQGRRERKEEIKDGGR